MKLNNSTVTLALLLSGVSAVPFPSDEEGLGNIIARGSGQVSPVQPPQKPKEYWLDPTLIAKRGGKEVQINGGEYWVAMGSSGKKRAVLEPNCAQAGKIVTCSYTLAEVEAARALGTELQDSCYHTTEGITCVYDVSAERVAYRWKDPSSMRLRIQHGIHGFNLARWWNHPSLRNATPSLRNPTRQMPERWGALYTADSITAISSALQLCKNVPCVLDSEAIFKARYQITPEIISAVREKLLPFTTVLSATVPEAKLLLDNAGIPIEYPQDMEDVKNLGKTLLPLGPKSVLIKREIFDEFAKDTTLHFVLCSANEEPLVDASRFPNPDCVTDMSYSIPGKKEMYEDPHVQELIEMEV
ncbi:hypothetical protein IFR05_005530 [Cadophora sp. M221]|nr:hypothetical protein IFR05_005530 [Cadophora sp. M221]